MPLTVGPSRAPLHQPSAGPPLRAGEELRAAAARFGFSATPRLDAELLLAHALGITRERLLLTLDDHVVPSDFATLVERRAEQMPIAYLTNTRAFWTIELGVGFGALVPRPDSETLIEAAVDHFAGTPGPRRVIDLGVGPGTLLFAALAEWPNATGLGIDRSEMALKYARGNRRRLGLEARAQLKSGDWLARDQGRCDLVLCNPPYIAEGAALPPEVSSWEPAVALYGGADGLDAYRTLAPQLGGALAPGGVACIEIGHDQADPASALFRAQGLAVAVRQDLGGRDRCLVITP